MQAQAVCVVCDYVHEEGLVSAQTTQAMSIGNCIIQLMSHKQTCVLSHLNCNTHTHLDLLMLPISESLLESTGPAVPMLK